MKHSAEAICAKMTEIILNRMDPNRDVRAPEEWRAGSRWRGSQDYLYEKVTGKDPLTKNGRKEAQALYPHPEILNQLSLDDFLEFFEMVMRRFYTQM